jgi:hypothetical protein
VARESEVIEFDPDAPAAVVGRMRELAESRDGWVNMTPLVDDKDVPTMSVGLLGWMSAKGPAVPEATWVPGERRRKGGVDPDSIGLQHRGGPKARFALADAGVPIPPGWRLLADHPKRGLVIELPESTDPAGVVDWLVRAARVLSPIDLPDEWAAIVYRR